MLLSINLSNCATENKTLQLRNQISFSLLSQLPSPASFFFYGHLLSSAHLPAGACSSLLRPWPVPGAVA